LSTLNTSDKYIMMEPWYQSQGPDTNEVKKILKEALTNIIVVVKMENGNRNPTKLLPFQVDFIVDKVVENYIVENRNSSLYFVGWGSYRGYYSFTHSELLQECTKVIEDQTDARQKIIKFFNNSPWLMNRLYRPPSEEYSEGLRYKSIKTHFENTVSNE